MMTYQAIKKKFPLKAAAVFGAFTDMEELVTSHPQLYTEASSKQRWPDFETRKHELFESRSAILMGGSIDGLPAHIYGSPVDEDGNADTKKEVTLVDLSASEARLIQLTTWKTYQKMRASGGYLSAPKPPPAKLPTLPAGHEPSIKELEGLWIGKLNFYLVPWPATMELRVRKDSGSGKQS
jgi:hypothetical protein